MPSLPAAARRLLESSQIDVALERKVRARIGGLGDGDVDPDAARQFDVDARRREVEVRRHQLSGSNERFREEVLGAPALVRRDQMAISVDLAHGGFEPEEAARSRVGLVAELHRRALLLRERGRAAVREEVDVDVLRAQKERVVPGACERGPARLGLDERDRLDDLDLPGRGPESAHLGESSDGSAAPRGGSCGRHRRTRPPVRRPWRPPGRRRG